jgi:hypothetical protein
MPPYFVYITTFFMFCQSLSTYITPKNRYFTHDLLNITIDEILRRKKHGFSITRCSG